MRSPEAAHHPTQRQDELTGGGGGGECVLGDPGREWKWGKIVMETPVMAKPLGDRGSSDKADKCINEVKC